MVRCSVIMSLAGGRPVAFVRGAEWNPSEDKERLMGDLTRAPAQSREQGRAAACRGDWVGAGRVELTVGRADRGADQGWRPVRLVKMS